MPRHQNACPRYHVRRNSDKCLLHCFPHECPGLVYLQGVYTTCPLCQRTVPLTFADTHVSVCLATPQPSSRPSRLRCSGDLPSPTPLLGTPHAQPLRQQLAPSGAATPTPSTQTHQPQHPQQHLQQELIDEEISIECKEGLLGTGNAAAGLSARSMSDALERAADSSITGHPMAEETEQQGRSRMGELRQQEHHQELATQQATQPGCTTPGSGTGASQAGAVSAFDIMRQVRAK